MAGEDLSLKAVIEAVLDAKGFEDFQAQLRKTGPAAEAAGKGADEAARHFNRLGPALPHTAFKLLSYDMIENAGIHGHIRPLIMLTTTAMDGLAASTRLMSNMMVGATLGLSLLIPLVMSMRKSSDDNKNATKDWTAEGLQLLDQLEELKTKTKNWTSENENLYRALKNLRDLEEEKKLAALRDKIAELTKQYRAVGDEEHAWGRIKIAYGNIVRGEMGETQREMEQRHDLLVQLDALTAQEGQLAGEVEHGTKTIKEQTDAADKNAQALKEAQEAKKRQQEYLIQADKDSQANMALFTKTQEDAYNDDFLAFHKAEEAKRKEAAKTAEQREQGNLQADRLIARYMEQSAHAVRADMIARRRAFEADLNARIADLRKAGADEIKIKAAIAAAEEAYSLQEAEIDRQNKEARLQQLQQLVSASFGLMTALFGKSKAAAIAEAIINTALGVTQALASGPPPGSWIMAATTAAMGAAEIVTITKSQPSGFDDPANDALVANVFRNFGRKWAQDMTSIASASARQGFGEGMTLAGGARAGMVQNTRIDRGVHIGNLNVHGLYGSGRSAALDIQRILIRGERIDRLTRR